MFGLDDLADSLVHEIETAEGAEGAIGNAFGNILKDAEHGAFSHRGMFTSEGIVAGEGFDGRFKEVVLILGEGVGVAELLLSAGDAVSTGAVHKFEEGLEVGLFLTIERRKLGADRAIAFFLEQTFLNNFGNIATGEVEPDGEAVLDFRKVRFLVHAGHVAHHFGKIFLGGNHDPCLTFALGGKTFGNGLHVDHELGIVGNVLAHFVDKEIETKAGLLLVDIFLNHFCKVLDGERETFLIAIEYFKSFLFRTTYYLGVDFGKFLIVEQVSGFPTGFPGLAGLFFVGFLEGGIFAFVV